MVASTFYLSILKRLSRIKMWLWRKTPDPLLTLWMALTFFGGALNYCVLRWMVTTILPKLSVLTWFPEMPVLSYYAFWIAFVSLVLAAIFVPVVYSGFASHFLPQKTLIRPLDMSVITGALLIYQENPLLTSNGALIVALLAGILLLGMISEIGAVSLVGYGRRPPHQRTLKVQAPIETMTKKFSEEGVKRAFHLDKHTSLYDDKLVIFRNDDSDYAFFVVLAQSDPSTTYVHMEGYDILRYVIEGTTESKRRFDHDADGITELIRKEISPRFGQTEDYALKFPFKSKIEEITHEPSVAKFSVVRRLPKTTIFILAGVALLALGAYFLYVNQGITGIGLEFFASTLIGLGVLLLGLIPFMKWTRKEKGWET